MVDVVVSAPAPVAPPPAAAKARLVAADGRTVNLSWAPTETTRDGSAAIWEGSERVGRKPVMSKTAEGLETLALTALMGTRDDQASIESELAKLEALARDGVAVQLAYGGLEAGWWRIDRLAFTSQRRNSANQVTRTTVELNLLEDSPPTVSAATLARVVAPASTPTTPNPTQPPGGTVSISLQNWKVTLPTGDPESPDEVGPPIPAAFSKSPYFVRNRDGSITFRAPCKGVSTSGSGYVRCELREMKGSKRAAWDSRDGTNTLVVTTKITKLPKSKPEAVTAQIHDSGPKLDGKNSDDIVMIRHVGRNVYMSKSKGKGKGADLVLLDSNYSVGDWYQVTIVAKASGITVTYLKGSMRVVKSWSGKTGKGWYFKAGIYNQSTESGGRYAEAIIRELRVGHGSPLAATPAASAPTTPAPVTVHFADSRITEASGLAASFWTDRLFTLNDEPDDPNLFRINPNTGATTGTCSVAGASLVDPEAVELDKAGGLWLADIGDNDAERSNVSIYKRGDPGDGTHGPLGFTRYRFDYPGGPRNSETFIINPVTNERFIVSKQATSHLYKLPSSLSTSAVNRLKDTGKTLGAYVADAAFTPDGKHVLVVRKDSSTKVDVYRPASGWAKLTPITVPSMTKMEGITVAPDGKSFWVTRDASGDSGAPLTKVSMPTAYRPT